jgi:hypothetical protein
MVQFNKFSLILLKIYLKEKIDSDLFLFQIQILDILFWKNLCFIMLTVYNSDHTENNDDNDSVGVRVGSRIGRGTRRKEEEFLLLTNQTNEFSTKNRNKTKITKSFKVDARCDEDEIEILKNELSELKKNMKTFGVVANFKAHIGIITSKTRIFNFKRQIIY